MACGVQGLDLVARKAVPHAALNNIPTVFSGTLVSRHHRPDHYYCTTWWPDIL